MVSCSLDDGAGWPVRLSNHLSRPEQGNEAAAASQLASVRRGPEPVDFEPEEENLAKTEAALVAKDYAGAAQTANDL